MAKKKVKKATSTALVPAKAASSVAEMTPTLQRIYGQMQECLTEIDGLTHKAHREIIHGWYHLGELAAEVHKSSKVGDGAIQKLADALGVARGKPVHSEQLNQAETITQIYSWAEIDKLLTKASEANVQIAWNHFAQGFALLKKKSDERTRHKYEAQLVAEALTVEQLTRLIRDLRHQRGETRGGTGRTRVSPKSPGAACRQIHKVGQEVQGLTEGWDESLFDWVGKKAAPEEMTPELLEDLQETQNDVFELGKTCETVTTKIEKAIKRVKKILDQKDELAQAAGGKRKKKGVHEDEDVEEEIDASDDDVEVEEEDVEVEEAHKSNGKAEGKPLSVKDRIAAAKAKAGK